MRSQKYFKTLTPYSSYGSPANYLFVPWNWLSRNCLLRFIWLCVENLLKRKAQYKQSPWLII